VIKAYLTGINLSSLPSIPNCKAAEMAINYICECRRLIINVLKDIGTSIRILVIDYFFSVGFPLLHKGFVRFAAKNQAFTHG